MALVKIKSLSDLPPQSMVQVKVAGSAYVLCHHDGTLRCFDGLCPHAGGPLGDGNLDGNQIVCPWHGWAFDCTSGVNDFDPSIQLRSYPLVVQDGAILVDLP